jgi:hypothetical protein
MSVGSVYLFSTENLPGTTLSSPFSPTPIHQRSISSGLLSGYFAHSASLDVFVIFDDRAEFSRAGRDAEWRLGFSCILWRSVITSYKAASVSNKRCSRVLRYPPGSPLNVLVSRLILANRGEKPTFCCFHCICTKMSEKHIARNVV